MSKKYTIQVRKYQPEQSKYGSESIGKITGDYGKFDVVETISRSLRGKAVGNFNPMFCAYKGAEHLVHSDEGDLSDPFRREDSYAKSLFITLTTPKPVVA